MIYATITGRLAVDGAIKEINGKNYIPSENDYVVLRVEGLTLTVQGQEGGICGNPDGYGMSTLVLNNADVTVDCDNGAIYDLLGRKVISAEANSSFFTLHSSLEKGIYIVNGKKTVIK